MSSNLKTKNAKQLLLIWVGPTNYMYTRPAHLFVCPKTGDFYYQRRARSPWLFAQAGDVNKVVADIKGILRTMVESDAY